MEAIFLKLLNMSITASWMIMAVIVLRVVLKNAPKFIHCILWALVAVRLICPVSFESEFSLVPSVETVSKENVNYTVDTGISTVDSKINEYLGEYSYIGTEEVNTKETKNKTELMDIIPAVWIAGVIAMTIYSIIVYVNIYRKVSVSMRLRDNIRICDNIESPFILGIMRPRIYLPSSLSEKEMECVLAHENAHLNRLDYLWKPIGFVILSVYWFNPFIWVAYILLCRDIELACDQKVIQAMNVEDKKEYSRILLSCSISHRMIAACPVAFGEVAVGRRVKSVLNYRKPAFWIMMVAIVACAVVSVCFLTNPKTYAEKANENNKVANDVDNKTDDNVNEKVDNSNMDISEKEVNVFNSDDEELVYLYIDEVRGCLYQVYLNTVENTFKMTYDVTWSYCRASGTYKVEGDKIILTDSDEPEEYVFDIVDGNLVFNAEQSTEMPLYAHEKGETWGYTWIGRKSDMTFDEAAYERYSKDSNYEIVRLTNDGYVYRNIKDVLTPEEYELSFRYFNESFKEGIVDWSRNAN